MWNGPGEPAIGQGNPTLLVRVLSISAAEELAFPTWSAPGGRGCCCYSGIQAPSRISHTHRGSAQETTELAKKFVPVFFRISVIPNCLEYTQRARAYTHTHTHTHTPAYLPSLLEKKGFTSVSFQTSFKRCFG